MNKPASVEDIVCGVSRYLRLNPLASDTLGGITQWWLRSMTVIPEDLGRALALLEGAGLVTAMHAADGQVHYRRTALTASIDAELDRLTAGGGGKDA